MKVSCRQHHFSLLRSAPARQAGYAGGVRRLAVFLFLSEPSFTQHKILGGNVPIINYLGFLIIPYLGFLIINYLGFPTKLEFPLEVWYDRDACAFS
jgi:hypothetical protein